MRIGYNTLSENAFGGSGSLDYFIEMSFLLPHLDKSNEYFFIVSKNGKRNFKEVETILGGYSNEHTVKRVISEHLFLPFALENNNIDIFFTTSSGGIAPYTLPAKTNLILGVFATQHYRNLFDKKRSMYRNILLKRSLQRAEIIVVNSNVSKQDVVNTNHVKPEQIRVVYHGIDERVFHADDTSIEEESFFSTHNIKAPFFLFVSNIYPYKNIYTLIEAYGRLSSKATMIFNLVIIGSFIETTKEESLKKINAICDKYKIHDQVKLLGKIGRQYTRVFYKKALAYVQTSLFENFGKTTLEAMACGCPVIGANVSATPEIVGGCGLLFEPTDVEELEEKMHTMVSNTSLRTKCSIEGLLKAKEYSLIKEAQNYITIFKEISR